MRMTWLVLGREKGHICEDFAAQFPNGTTKQRFVDKMLQLLPVPEEATKDGFCPN